MNGLNQESPGAKLQGSSWPDPDHGASCKLDDLQAVVATLAGGKWF